MMTRTTRRPVLNYLTRLVIDQLVRLCDAVEDAVRSVQRWAGRR